jgi:hypothetical protein
LASYSFAPYIKPRPIAVPVNTEPIDIELKLFDLIKGDAHECKLGSKMNNNIGDIALLVFDEL